MNHFNTWSNKRLENMLELYSQSTYNSCRRGEYKLAVNHAGWAEAIAKELRKRMEATS